MSEATRILAIRHGQTAWNADGRIQGHTDIALDDTGEWQAERLAQALGDEDAGCALQQRPDRVPGRPPRRWQRARGWNCASTPACANAASANSKA